jgi:hypothetical protein
MTTSQKKTSKKAIGQKIIFKPFKRMLKEAGDDGSGMPAFDVGFSRDMKPFCGTRGVITDIKYRTNKATKYKFKFIGNTNNDYLNEEQHNWALTAEMFDVIPDYHFKFSQKTLSKVDEDML